MWSTCCQWNIIFSHCPATSWYHLLHCCGQIWYPINWLLGNYQVKTDSSLYTQLYQQRSSNQICLTYQMIIIQGHPIENVHSISLWAWSKMCIVHCAMWFLYKNHSTDVAKWIQCLWHSCLMTITGTSFGNLWQFVAIKPSHKLNHKVSIQAQHWIGYADRDQIKGVEPTTPIGQPEWVCQHTLAYKAKIRVTLIDKAISFIPSLTRYKCSVEHMIMTTHH